MPDPSTNDLLSLLDTLIPPKEIRAVDIHGNAFTFPAAVPARRQQQALRKLMGILDLPVLAEQRDALGKLTGNNPTEQLGTLLGLIRNVAGDEQLLDILCDTIRLAYPDFAKDLDLADLFELDQLIGILIPLAVRLVKGLQNQIKPNPQP